MHNVTGAAFVELVQDASRPDSRQVCYFSHIVDELSPAVGAAVRPDQALRVINEPGTSSSSSESILWVGSTGAVTQGHYDLSHNMYVQVLGEKQVVLFPPTAQMRVPSMTHKFHRQSALDIQGWLQGRQTIDTAVASEALIVTLSPGDVLYIPPFWYHHLRAVSPSASVAIWTTSRVGTHKEDLEKLPIPFEESWDTETLAPAVCELARQIEPASIGRIQERHISSPVEPLLASAQPSGSSSQSAQSSSPSAASNAKVPLEKIREKVATGVRRYLGALHGFPPGVRELALDDHLESIAVWALGDKSSSAQVAALFRACDDA